MTSKPVLLSGQWHRLCTGSQSAAFLNIYQSASWPVLPSCQRRVKTFPSGGFLINYSGIGGMFCQTGFAACCLLLPAFF
jgi:hypothetical protein